MGVGVLSGVRWSKLPSLPESIVLVIRKPAVVMKPLKSYCMNNIDITDRKAVKEWVLFHAVQFMLI